MKALTYFAILFATIFVCFLFSFHPKLKFNKHFGSFLKASILVAVPFIVWDIYFTKLGVWWFDYSYTTGVSFFGLPIEECLFFVCIPFSCVFTYYCLNRFMNWKKLEGLNTIISCFFILLMTVSIVCFYDKMYTALTSVVLLATFIYLQFIARVNWVTKAIVVYTILLFGFLPVNGVLTGSGIDSPIVNYNPNEFLGVRIGTIPVEDWFYGLAQFLLNLYFFQLFSESKKQLQSAK